MFPFLLPLLGLIGAGAGAAAGISNAVTQGNNAKAAQEQAYKATLERQDYERSHTALAPQDTQRTRTTSPHW